MMMAKIFTNLQSLVKQISLSLMCLLTLDLNASLSSKVIVSALAITGTILTNSSKRFINSISIGRKLNTIQGSDMKISH